MGDRSALDRLAARQHGVFSKDQARTAGFDRHAARRRVAAGEWVVVDDSVYALASAPRVWEQTVEAAVLSRPAAVLTHLPAAHLLGVPGIGKSKPVILVPRGSNARSPLARVVESDQFDSIGQTTVHGHRVTTMPETLLVIARDFRGTRFEEIFDQALIAGVLDLEAMSRVLDREAGRRTPGAPQLRRLVVSRRPSAPSHSSSRLERLLEQLLGDTGVPPWMREAEFLLGGEPARVDVYIPSARLVIEADGRNWHTKWADFDKDHRRDNALATRGIQVLRYTYRMLTSEPARCLEEILTTCLIRAA